MKRVALLAAGLLAFALAAQAEVAEITYIRSLETVKTGPSTYEVTCYTQAIGIDETHNFQVSLALLYAGNYYYPYSVDVGPTNRRVRLSEPGVWDFKVVLRKGTLTATRVLYLSEAPAIGSAVTCTTATYDLTTSTYIFWNDMRDGYR